MGRGRALGENFDPETQCLYNVPDWHDCDIVSQVDKQDDAFEIVELKKTGCSYQQPA